MEPTSIAAITLSSVIVFNFAYAGCYQKIYKPIKEYLRGDDRKEVENRVKANIENYEKKKELETSI
jgi:hypothetical protein